MANDADTDILGLTAQIVSAHIGNNYVVANVLPELIQSVYHSLATAGTSEPAAAPLTPAVATRKSVFPGHIVCLEDGQKLKTLKRHLQASHGMTPDEYRQKWGLPASYLMVAPNYANLRSSMAKQFGLGQKPGSPKPTNLAKKSETPDLSVGPPVTLGRARRARGSRG